MKTERYLFSLSDDMFIIVFAPYMDARYRPMMSYLVRSGADADRTNQLLAVFAQKAADSKDVSEMQRWTARTADLHFWRNSELAVSDFARAMKDTIFRAHGVEVDEHVPAPYQVLQSDAALAVESEPTIELKLDEMEQELLETRKYKLMVAELEDTIAKNRVVFERLESERESLRIELNSLRTQCGALTERVRELQHTDGELKQVRTLVSSIAHFLGNISQ